MVLTIDQRVRAVIVEELGLQDDAIASDASLDRDLGADSTDRFSLTMALEDEFRMEIPNDEAAQLHIVRDVVAYITEHADEASA